MLWVLMHGFPGFTSGDDLGQNSFGAAGSGYAWWAAFLLEVLMTAVLVGVVLAVTDARNEHPALAPLAIGLTLAVIHFASMARHRHVGQPGPLDRGRRVRRHRRASGQLWLFILAPLLGGPQSSGPATRLVLGRGAEPVARSGLRRPAAGGPHGRRRARVQGARVTRSAAQPAADRLASPCPGGAHRPPHAEPQSGRPRAPSGPRHPSERTYPDDPAASLAAAGLPASTRREPYWSQQIPREWGLAAGRRRGRAHPDPPHRRLTRQPHRCQPRPSIQISPVARRLTDQAGAGGVPPLVDLPARARRTPR